MTYEQIKAMTDAELFAAFDAEEASIGARRDVGRSLLRRFAAEISYRASDDSRAAEKAERSFGC